MPGTQWQYGFPVAVLVMWVISVLLYRAFRRNGWL
jgi:magnesium transporter